MARIAVVVAVYIGVGAGCYSTQNFGEQREGAYLEIDCTPKDAEIYVDDRYMGIIAYWRKSTVPVRPGARRIQVLYEGYYPYLFDLNAKPGQIYRLKLDLIPDVDAASAQDALGSFRERRSPAHRARDVE